MPSGDNTLDLTEYFAQHKQHMLDLVIELARVNSGSLNLSGIKQVRSILQEHFAVLGGQQTVMPVAPMKFINDAGVQEERELGSVLRIWKRSEAPLQVLLLGHMDTVFGVDHKFQEVQLLDEGRLLHGPGVTDMKGGLVVLLWALQALEQTKFAENIGWEVLLTADEEIGSPGSAEIIANCAKKHSLAFVFEPALDEAGNLAGARKGSANYTLVMHGKTAHAGRNFFEGRNAICKMADVITEINSLNGEREGVTFNVGYIHGGEVVNSVPEICVCKINVRVPKMLDADWAHNCLQTIVQEINEYDQYTLDLHGGFQRKPKELDPETLRLYELVQQIAAKQNLQLSWQSCGGVSDGNNLSEVGLPNVDTLGVRGGKIHSGDEYLVVASLTERAELLANILISISENGFK